MAAVTSFTSPAVVFLSNLIDLMMQSLMLMPKGCCSCYCCCSTGAAGMSTCRSADAREVLLVRLRVVDFPQMMLLVSASGQPHTDEYRRELPTDNTAMMHLTFTVCDA